MRYTVKEEFVTPLHRFPEDAEIDESEIDGPLSAEEWVARGMLSPVTAAEPEPPTEPAPAVEAEAPEHDPA